MAMFSSDVLPLPRDDKSSVRFLESDLRIEVDRSGSRDQHHADFISKMILQIGDKLLADMQALEALVYREVGQVTAVDVVGNRSGDADQLAVAPCADDNVRMVDHSLNSGDVLVRAFDARIFEYLPNVHCLDFEFVRDRNHIKPIPSVVGTIEFARCGGCYARQISEPRCPR